MARIFVTALMVLTVFGCQSTPDREYARYFERAGMPPIDVALEASERMAEQDTAPPPQAQSFVLGGQTSARPTIREAVGAVVGAVVGWPIVVTGTALSLMTGWPGELL